jgi:hypothetical protein
MARMRVVARTRPALARAANPQSAKEPEALPWVLFDTQAWTTAATVTQTYFTTVQNDKTLGNMEGPGQLPDPQYFEVHYIGCDFLLSPNSVASVAAAGPLNDIAQFLFAQRGIWTFNISNKRVGPFPLSFLHASGGPTGYLAITNAAAAQKNEYANNGIFDGGFCVGGALLIPPKVSFDITLQVAAVLTLQTSPLNVRIWMAGALYRRVL